MKKVVWILLFPLALGCSSKGKYDINRYYDIKEQDQLMAQILPFILDAPPGVTMKNRFNPEHKFFYTALTSKFSFDKYFIADDGTHYFYIVRPGPEMTKRRGVAGHYKMKENFKLENFREEFVTPLLTESEVRGRCAFLFDEMVNGKLEQYLKMETYVQWPNEISYYDTLTYEWKMIPGIN